MSRKFDSSMDLKTLSESELSTLLRDVQAETMRMREEKRQLEASCSDSELRENDWYKRLIAANRHMMLLLRRCCIETLLRKEQSFEKVFQKICHKELPKEQYIALEVKALQVMTDV